MLYYLGSEWIALRTMGWEDEQDRFGWFFPVNRTEKVPQGAGRYTPRRISPRIMIYYAPTAKAIRQSRTSPPGVPLPPFLRPSLPALTFPRSALTEQGAKTIAYNQSKNESKRKEKQVITYKQDKEKSKRDPRKAYKHTSKEGKGKLYYSPLCLYNRIAIYIL